MIKAIFHSIFKPKKRNHLDFDEIQTIQLVVQQTVLSLDVSKSVPEPDKAALASQISIDLLEEMGISAPSFFIEIVVAASARLLQERPSPCPLPNHQRPRHERELRRRLDGGSPKSGLWSGVQSNERPLFLKYQLQIV